MSNPCSSAVSRHEAQRNCMRSWRIMEQLLIRLYEPLIIYLKGQEKKLRIRQLEGTKSRFSWAKLVTSELNLLSVLW